jgi:hypothetical protein
MIRGTIKKCKARLASNNSTQKDKAKPSIHLDSLTYQRSPAGRGLGSDVVSGMAGEWFKQFELSQANTYPLSSDEQLPRSPR